MRVVNYFNDFNSSKINSNYFIKISLPCATDIVHADSDSDAGSVNLQQELDSMDTATVATGNRPRSQVNDSDKNLN